MTVKTRPDPGIAAGNPISMRDRIIEIDQTSIALVEERQSLLDQIRALGFEPVIPTGAGYIPKPTEWKKGDIVRCVNDSELSYFHEGNEYKVAGPSRTDSEAYLFDRCNDAVTKSSRFFAWVRRP